ncbi:MAG TPA: tRNA pseudouridine(55) synthase TruB [Myxococcota bacterium]|nr:tRNA pseudouridine(55) synthase TruB [Myxococcota bacterium]
MTGRDDRDHGKPPALGTEQRPTAAREAASVQAPAKPAQGARSEPKASGARERLGPIGFLAIDKPVGWSSHDVVDAARRWLGTRRVGHLGTLDPLATGVLPLAIREATKLIPFVDQHEKVYAGTIRLGSATDTFDAEGKVVRTHHGPLPDEEAVRAALVSFSGDLEQIPPMYSSVKKDGVPLYRLARKGEEVEREPRRVRIHRIALTRFEPPDVGVEVACSPGTYVRVLAADLGEKLGCGAHLAGLRRTANGPFAIADSLTPELCDALASSGELDARILPPAKVLTLPEIALSGIQARRVANGGAIAAAEARGPFERGPQPMPGGKFAALTPAGDLLAVMELRPDRKFHPLRVFPPAS